MTIADAKRFLSPVRKSNTNKGSPVPIGANENFFNNLDNQVIVGLTEFVQYQQTSGHPFNHNVTVSPENMESWMKFPIYDVSQLCSSWAPAVTSAMSISVSRWHDKFINFSLQFVLDCDLLGDACIERTPLSAYQLFWKTLIPQYTQWDIAEPGKSERTHPMHAPRPGLNLNTDGPCLKRDGQYPGTSGGVRDWALTGTCEPGSSESACPIYFLYNWRWIKSHIWEVGAVTSSILVKPDFFVYSSGIYSYNDSTTQEVIGMLDVTIIGWGQAKVNLSTDAASHTATKNRWWWVIPHLGCDFGLEQTEIVSTTTGTNVSLKLGIQKFSVTGSNCNATNNKGIMKFNRRFDDCNIESNAVGAVPFNFYPMPVRTPEQTSS